MKTRILIVASLALALAGCKDERKQAMDRIDEDRDVLADANGAANQVIRNSADCEVARPLMTEAYQKIEQARGRLRTAASQQTLGALKAQVDRVARACGTEQAPPPVEPQ